MGICGISSEVLTSGSVEAPREPDKPPITPKANPQRPISNQSSVSGSEAQIRELPPPPQTPLIEDEPPAQPRAIDNSSVVSTIQNQQSVLAMKQSQSRLIPINRLRELQAIFATKHRQLELTQVKSLAYATHLSWMEAFYLGLLIEDNRSGAVLSVSDPVARQIIEQSSAFQHFCRKCEARRTQLHKKLGLRCNLSIAQLKRDFEQQLGGSKRFSHHLTEFLLEVYDTLVKWYSKDNNKRQRYASIVGFILVLEVFWERSWRRNIEISWHNDYLKRKQNLFWLPFDPILTEEQFLQTIPLITVASATKFILDCRERLIPALQAIVVSYELECRPQSQPRQQQPQQQRQEMRQQQRYRAFPTDRANIVEPISFGRDDRRVIEEQRQPVVRGGRAETHGTQLGDIELEFKGSATPISQQNTCFQ